MSTATRELARVEPNGASRPAGALQRYSIAEVQMMAEEVARSGLYAGIPTPQAAFTLMMLCQSEGLHPMKALKRYHIIEGRPSMRADAMQAEFQAGGGWVRWKKFDAVEARAVFGHREHCPDGVELAVSFREMDEAGITRGKYGVKDNWKKFPGAMLRARLISMAVRMIDPGTVVGVYTPEEVVDFASGAAPPEVVEVESRPAEHADNATGHGRGQYASPEQSEKFLAQMDKFLARKNAEWLDGWQAATGEIPSGVKDLLNRWQLDNHLVKWARESGRLEIPGDHAENHRNRNVGRYTAILHFRSKGDRAALWTEMDDYARTQAALQTEAIYRKHPELRPAEDVADAEFVEDGREPGDDDPERFGDLPY